METVKGRKVERDSLKLWGIFQGTGSKVRTDFYAKGLQISEALKK